MTPSSRTASPNNRLALINLRLLFFLPPNTRFNRRFRGLALKGSAPKFKLCEIVRLITTPIVIDDWGNSQFLQIPTKLTVLANDANLINELAKLIENENVAFLVAGQPRTLEGRETDQTRTTLKTVDFLRQELNLPIYLQDEAGTSLKAEEELRNNHKNYLRSDIDQLSAVYILEDFMNDHRGGKNLD